MEVAERKRLHVVWLNESQFAQVARMIIHLFKMFVADVSLL